MRPSLGLSKGLNLLKATALIALAAIVCGCSTPAPKAIADWHDAVLAVRDQSATTFRGVNDLVREAQLNRAANLPNLKESDFQPGLDATSIAAWNRALDSLTAYSAGLSTLVSPELASGVGDSTQRIAESIATTAKSDVFTQRPGLASALNKLGTKIASLSAGQSAKTIMAQADPAVNDVLNQMAKMIDDDSSGVQSGVYQTVHASWTVKADEIRVEFLRAPASEKRNVAAKYATTLEQRDAAEAAILGLKQSLLELAAAHSRAAAGGSMDTGALIANIREQTAFFKSLLNDLKPVKK
jgi:hypothetical protein